MEARMKCGLRLVNKIGVVSLYDMNRVAVEMMALGNNQCHSWLHSNWFNKKQLSCWYMAVVVQSLSHVSLRPDELQHVRLSWSLLKLMSIEWCYLTNSSSAVLLFFCRQSFPISGSFQMSWLFASGGQSIGASASVLPMNRHIVGYRLCLII